MDTRISGFQGDPARTGGDGRSLTYSDFVQLFPTPGACLDYLKQRFYPDGTACPQCGKVSKFHRIRGRTAYSCQFCGTQVYPTAGTIFHKSTTSLQMWFWAIFLISSTRGSISVRELEQEIGVSYKTAQRMSEQIRNLLFPRQAPRAEGEVREPEAMRPAPRIWQSRRRQI